MLFSKPKKSIGLDIGSHSVKAVQMSRSGGRLCLDEVGYALVDRTQVSEDPALALSEAVRQALERMAPAQSCLVAGLPGQNVVIRYPRLPDTDRSGLDAAVEREAGQNIPYDLEEVTLDWSLLDEVEEGDQKQLKVLLVAAKHEVIDSRVEILQAADLQCSILGVDSLALADGAEGCDFLRVGETVALINVGLNSASIHFVRDGISNFIRDVNWGARELVQATAKGFRCDAVEAERKLQEAAHAPAAAPPAAMAMETMPDAEIEEITPVVIEEVEAIEFVDAEEITEAAPDDPFGAPADDPFGAPAAADPFGGPPAADPFAPAAPAPSGGGGSLLDPLDEELEGGAGGASVLGGGGGAGFGGGYGMEESGEPDMAEVLAPPLSRLVSEIRRSFDYYEHQRYERPVDRIILSGGVAHLPLISETMRSELGIESVEVADPTSSALFLGDEAAMSDLHEHPAQFMVAIGLAARGMADL